MDSAMSAVVCVESLPFLVPEAQRACLQAWRREAVEREKRHAARRLEQLRQLQSYVSARLQELHVSKRLSLRPTHTSPPLTGVQGPQAIFPSPPHSQEPHTSSPPHHLPPALQNDSGSGGHRNFKVPPAPHPPVDPFTKLTALARGFLTRRFLQSDKISHLINTIKDGGEVLAGITEPVSQQDMALQDRVSTQMQLARVSLLELLQLPVAERMMFIAQSRLSRQQKRTRKKVPGTVSGGRLSLATQRLIVRRQRSSTTLPATQDHKVTPTHAKPAPQREHRDRFSGAGGRGVRPAGHSKMTPCPNRAAVEAKKNKTNTPSKSSGHAPTTKGPQSVSGQPSRSGQVKLGRRRPIAGHSKPVKGVGTVRTKTRSKVNHS